MDTVTFIKTLTPMFKQSKTPPALTKDELFEGECNKLEDELHWRLTELENKFNVRFTDVRAERDPCAGVTKCGFYHRFELRLNFETKPCPTP